MIDRAKELLALPNSNDLELIECLIQISENIGYIKAVKNFRIRDGQSTNQILKELNYYLEQIKCKIKNKYTI